MRISQSAVTILTPAHPTAAEHRAAVLLRRHLQGAGMTVTERGGYPVRIGFCSAAEKPAGDHGYIILGDASGLYVTAASAYGYEAATDVLTGEILTPENDETTVLRRGNGRTRLTAEPGRIGDLRIFSNNLWGDGTVSPEQRADMLLSVYLTYHPDVMGFQEFHNGIRGFLASRLEAAGYREVRFDIDSINDGSSVNSTPVFYDPSAVELLDKGYFWYNNIPFADEVYAGLRGDLTPNDVKEAMAFRPGQRWDYSKGYSYGIFKLKKTGRLFLAASTHLWWMDKRPVDDVCRQIQIAAAKERLLQAADAFMQKHCPGDGRRMPVFLLGDFNLTQHMASYRTVVTDSPVTDETRRHNAFVNTNDLTPTGERITVTTNHHREGRYNGEDDIFEDPCIETQGYEYSLDYIFVDDKTAAGDWAFHRSCRVADLTILLATDHCPVFIDATPGETSPKL